MVVQRKIGAAPVTDESRNLDGVISGRDIVRGFETHGAALTEKSVGELMTTTVISRAPENSISDVAELMSKHNLRHIAVLADDALTGFISIRDVAFYRLTGLKVDNETLHLMVDNYEAVA